ncbi:TetR/AcrR family transcriptional regulator [Virgisporangium aurantiacum]|uniref:TetR/AcrR family transcriptional regulator n=1 Tax=Virgisporangium aurantiacum TaxID=175570 RepID=UPI001952542B|nr:TetR/AcrR family transcriptional regulator [Virgisporangium aurantiacum]
MAPDSRDRMVRAAIELFRERGYAATSFGDVLARSGAPRGSIYHHFPGGKEELAAEALRRYTAATVRALTAAIEAGTAVEAVRAFIAASRDSLVASGFRQSCPIAGVALDLMPADGALAGYAAEAFDRWRELIAVALKRDGVPAVRASALATLVVATAEGALLLARVDRSPTAIDAAGAELLAHVAAVVDGTGTARSATVSEARSARRGRAGRA